jgi:hypothetical protein
MKTPTNFLAESLKLFPPMAAILGAGFILMSVLNSVSADRFLSDAYQVEAQVVRVETKIIENSEYYRPTLAYQTDSGETRSYTESTWSRPQILRTGERVVAWARLDSDELRSQARIEKDEFFAKVLLELGVISSLFGFGLLLGRRWLKARQT